MAKFNVEYVVAGRNALYRTVVEAPNRAAAIRAVEKRGKAVIGAKSQMYGSGGGSKRG